MISLSLLLLLSISLIFDRYDRVHSFTIPTTASSIIGTSRSTGTVLLYMQKRANSNDDEESKNKQTQMERRAIFQTGKVLLTASVSSTFLSAPSPASALNNKSRSDGYAVQYTEREWAYLLSGKQYNILRQGGTERQYSSILEGEEREGEYICAGCATPLFTSSAKFHSGTGWPSYASALPGVEIEDVNPVQANLLGAEIRCKSCGGHLGDVFNDGIIYVNTPAFSTGKRFCVDGAALIFKPKDGSADVFGDLSPPPSNSNLPDFLSPPKIVPT